MVALGLTFLTILAVLLGPILIKPLERNVEIFFLVAGTIIAAVAGQLTSALVRSALREPIELTAAVLVFGIVFRWLRARLDRLLSAATRMFGQRWLCFALTIVLGLLAGIITAVMAGIVFAEAISLLNIDRSTESPRLPRMLRDWTGRRYDAPGDAGQRTGSGRAALRLLLPGATAGSVRDRWIILLLTPTLFLPKRTAIALAAGSGERSVRDGSDSGRQSLYFHCRPGRTFGRASTGG